MTTPKDKYMEEALSFIHEKGLRQEDAIGVEGLKLIASLLEERDSLKNGAQFRRAEMLQATLERIDENYNKVLALLGAFPELKRAIIKIWEAKEGK